MITLSDPVLFSLHKLHKRAKNSTSAFDVQQTVVSATGQIYGCNMDKDQHITRYSTIPLPVRKYVPGRNIHPRKHSGGSHIPPLPESQAQFDVQNWQNSIRYLYAIDLFNHEYWWEAHEVLEELWIETGRTTEIARFLQGIIQVAAALLKKLVSKNEAAGRLLTRGLSKMRQQSGHYLGIDVAQFSQAANEFFAGRRQPPPRLKIRDS